MRRLMIAVLILLACSRFPLAGNAKEAKTMNLKIEDGPKGKVAILSDSFPHQASHADPRVLAATLRAYGFGVTLLKVGDLADPGVLNWGNFDCVVLPYGPYYPRSAEGVIRAFLKSGGGFVSMGGYAFDSPCVRDASGKLVTVDVGETITAQDVANSAVSDVGMNTRHGKPGDTLGLIPDQIGVFDPTYHLLNAVGLRAAPMPSLVPSAFKAKVPVKGYAACSLLGSNSPVFPEKWGRHVPIADAYDKYGRSVGPVGSIAHNYAGPYAGSSWVFFGVTNTDLFAKNGPMLPHLGSVVDAVTRKSYLHSLATDMACYKDGEWAIISVKLANYGRKPFSGKVTFSIYDRNGKSPAGIPPVAAYVKAGTTADLETEWRPLKFDSDLYHVVAQLSVEGKVVDTLETGFVAYDKKVTAGGLKLNLKDNYFHDGDRPVLLSGTNVTGAMFYSQNENPLVWDRDLARMQESGVNILRLLHFSPFVSENPASMSTKPLDLNADALPIQTERKLDALVQLCQKHKVALFLTIHDWMGIDLTDEELAAQRKFAQLIAARYKDVPGFMIDIQNEPQSPRDSDAPHITKLWNDWLRDKYGTDEALKAAWRVSPPEKPLGEIAYKPGTQAWDDMRTFDADAFRNFLVNHWIEANREGVRAGDPNMPVTVGFLQEYFALNKLMCMDGLDFANMHSYTGIDTLRADLKLFDRRFEGKSLSLGEFGSVADHNKRNDGLDSDSQDWSRYLQTGHYVFGEGGSFLANWCWKDMDDVVFPWGINYPNEGPRKDILKAYRNQSLLFRQVRPVYKSPDTFLVVPTHMMIGGQSNGSIKVLYQIVNKMLDNHWQFGVIDDEHLDKLPASANTLVYPMPFGITDKAYAKLKSWVENGGVVTITGDISYDANRQRTHTDRLEELCGVRFVSENYPTTNWPNTQGLSINVVPTTAEDTSVGLYSNSLGGGMVQYCPDPAARTTDGGSLFDLLPESDNGLAHVLQLNESTGSSTCVLANPSETRQVAHAGGGPALTVGPGGTGLVRYDKAGQAVSVEAQGSITRNGKTIPMKGHWALISCDGKDITQSREMIILPFGGGEIDLEARSQESEVRSQKEAEKRSTPNTPKPETRNPEPNTLALVVQTGDVVNGKWQVLSESTNLKIKASGADAFDIRIVAPRNRLKSLAQHVVSELMLASSQ